MSLRILEPGLSCTVQDAGRRGYRRRGLATGGAADLHAFRWANKLLDNDPRDACLEIMMGGFRAVATDTVTIALTGAGASVRVNGRQVGHWRTHTLAADDTLDIGMSRTGRLIYLALPGGVDSPVLFGSRSMVVREKFAGHTGLAAGHSVGARSLELERPFRVVPDSHQRDYLDDGAFLDLLPGYQYQDFSREDLLRLLHSEYRVTQRSNRMGYCLSGTAMAAADWQIHSEGMVIGAVQIPGNGQPIVLMPDCQTIGGYPKPGTLSPDALGRLAQCQPGDRIRFRLISPEECQIQQVLGELFFQRTCWEGNGRDLRWC